MRRRKFMTALLAISFAAGTSSCGSQGGLLGGPNMTPGEWELRTWMEFNGQQGRPEDELTQPRTLTAETASLPVPEILFGVFYPGKSPENIVAQDGKISGTIEQAGVAPYPAHTQSVTGSYSETQFRMEIDLSVASDGLVQIVEGRLVEATQ